MAMNKEKMNDDQLDLVTGGSILPYRVQPGDSLNVIAKKYNVTVEQLQKWNNISDPSMLTVGQQLKIKF
ncbi:MAG: LysM peptidoglycan-binding domain-containing protein [Oscillospiraceae bacterium]|nr:LysM peptidoglycan-binding domain-containing protein [Oscillospiraceae bacterium]